MQLFRNKIALARKLSALRKARIMGEISPRAAGFARSGPYDS
jgi:hypothetical protein